MAPANIKTRHQSHEAPLLAHKFVGMMYSCWWSTPQKHAMCTAWGMFCVHMWRIWAMCCVMVMHVLRVTLQFATHIHSAEPAQVIYFKPLAGGHAVIASHPSATQTSINKVDACVNKPVKASNAVLIMCQQQKHASEQLRGDVGLAGPVAAFTGSNTLFTSLARISSLLTLPVTSC